jgi:hypothetical protein
LHLLGDELIRLNDTADEGNLIEWPNTVGYMYRGVIHKFG